MDLKVKSRSNHQNDIRNEFLDPKKPKNRILWRIVGQTIAKIIFNMVDGGHLGFGTLTEFPHTFARGMGAKYFLKPS